MISRREILVAGSGGLAALGLASIAGPAGAHSAVTVPTLFVVDTSLPGSVAAAGAARRAGIPLAVFAGDVGSVWLEHLQPLWRRGPSSIAGATRGGALFCAERLARDFGLACAFHVSPPLSGESLGRAAELAIDAAGRPLGRGSPPISASHDLPVVWALVPRRSRQSA